MKSFIVAFSTYSKIPMPQIEWDEKSRKYSMCFFPLVGMVIGGLLLLAYAGCDFLGCSPLLRGLLCTIIPIFITGGIHMDGFMDTLDAKNSYRSKEERLEILKDPHTGAFAVLFSTLYLIASVILFSELDETGVFFVAMGYVYSRILSGLSVITLKKAKDDGMVSGMARVASKEVKWILLIELLVCIVVVLLPGILFATGMWRLPEASLLKNEWIWRGSGLLLAGGGSFLYYKHMAYKWFGGITGDLAGYFLQVCELLILVVMVVL